MKTRVFSCVFAVVFLLPVFQPSAETGSLLGFELNISSERAFERAARTGLETVEKGENKDNRMSVVFNGAAVDIFTAGEEKIKTRLVFFKDKIETATLIVSPATEQEALSARSFITDRYGEPSVEEEVFSYSVKSWKLPDSKVVLSYARGGVLKLSHIHLPTRKNRYERNLQRDKIKDKRPPAQRMIDGDFSKPDYK